MENIERLLVHVEEAYRMAVVRDPAHLRLSLLLFDSAAELILHRAAEDRLAWQEYPLRTLEGLRRVEADRGPLPHELVTMKHKLEQEVVSKKRRKEIDRNFGAKVEYLAATAELPTSLASVLGKLHRYRNEAYHRDRVRDSTIETAVHIYSYVVCELMRWMKIPWYTHVIPPPPAVSKYVGTGLEGFRVLSIAADHLESEFAFNDEPVAGYLSQHLLSRLDEIDEDLDSAASFADGDWDAKAILHFLQLDDAAHVKPQQLRSCEVPFTMDGLAKCRERAAEVSELPDPIDAFRAFAEIEDEFEKVEEALAELLGRFDDAIQAEVDRMRGK